MADNHCRECICDSGIGIRCEIQSGKASFDGLTYVSSCGKWVNSYFSELLIYQVM